MAKKLTDWSPADIALAAEQAACEARENFWAFRRYMRPDMLWGWWVEKVSIELQMFYEDIVAGKRPTLVLMTPPQHGKTTAAEDFIAWLAGRHPDHVGADDTTAARQDHRCRGFHRLARRQAS
jgi:hypothetical protein